MIASKVDLDFNFILSGLTSLHVHVGCKFIKSLWGSKFAKLDLIDRFFLECDAFSGFPVILGRFT